MTDGRWLHGEQCVSDNVLEVEVNGMILVDGIDYILSPYLKKITFRT